MERASKTVKSMFAAMTQRGERSTLFWWFVENHDDIAEAAKRQRIQWAVVVDRANELGLTNRVGAAPTRKLAKLTWHRAQIYVASFRSATDPPVAEQAVPNPMPRSVTARPSLAERVSAPRTFAHGFEPSAGLSEQDDCSIAPAISEAPMQLRRAATPVVGSGIGNSPSVVDTTATEDPPMQTGTEVALTRPTAVERAWTPEQIAHRDAVLASARAQLDYADRFLKLQE